MHNEDTRGADDCSPHAVGHPHNLLVFKNSKQALAEKCEDKNENGNIILRRTQTWISVVIDCITGTRYVSAKLYSHL